MRLRFEVTSCGDIRRESVCLNDSIESLDIDICCRGSSEFFFSPSCRSHCAFISLAYDPLHGRFYIFIARRLADICATPAIREPDFI
jgi:hypothetical protein